MNGAHFIEIPLYHFPDDTSIMQSNLSLERLSKQVNKDFSNLSNWLRENKLKQVNKDLSNLSNWLRAKKLSLNVKKTELVIFRPRKLKIMWLKITMKH